MNKVILIGRLTRDPELRTIANGTPTATFSLAVIGIIKGPLLAEFKIPFFKVITWLFPPIYEIITGCDLATKQINMVDILSPCVYAIIYGIILAIINVIVIDKNGF